MLLSAVSIALQVHISPHCSPEENVTGRFFGEHVICVDATGHNEKYQIEGPLGALSAPCTTYYPLIVLFHAYGEDHTILEDTRLQAFRSAAINPPYGYLVMMADGGFDSWGGYKTYGNESFQRHTEAAIRDVIEQFCVDRNRIYGYGFSMGGGNVLSYAARHLDPTATEGMFAAAVNHSGAVSVPMSYYEVGTLSPPVCDQCSTPCDAQPIQECFFNCLYSDNPSQSYCTNPFPFQRATVLDIVCLATNTGTNCPVPCGGVAGLDTSLARNLFERPIRTYYFCNDTNVGLKTQNLELGTFMSSLGAAHYSEVIGTATNPHTWGSVDANAVLNFFGMYDLPATFAASNFPLNYRSYTLLPEDGRRYLFFVGQRASTSDFGRVDWAMNLNFRTIRFYSVATRNLSLLTLLLDSWTPLSKSPNLTAIIEDPMRVALRGYATQPTRVYKNGTLLPPPSSEWSYDFPSQTVTVNLGLTAGASWKIVP